MEFSHKPVLLNEVIEYMNIRPGGTYVDGTLGGAGHSLEIAKRLGSGGRLIGIDQDKEALEKAGKVLEPFIDKVTVVRSNYSDYHYILRDLGIERVDGILLDIGVSSYQFDNPERGFSYRADAPLDMRMDRNASVTAADIVNDYPQQELFRVIRDYGEEPFAGSIAANIVKARQSGRINTTFELNRIIRASVPAKAARDKHPSKKTFQALRIEVNKEIDVLTDSIDGMIDSLAPGGRLLIITFHSLEDRVVKTAFRRNADPCICPPEFPVCVCGRKPKGFVVTRKPVTAGEDELRDNRRAHSAKLRVFERTAYED